MKKLFKGMTINKKTLLIGVIIVVLTILIDQITKIYMEKKEDDFNNFKEVGDINLITTDELITNGLINESIEVPNDKELKDYYVKAKIEEDGSISYVVVG